MEAPIQSVVIAGRNPAIHRAERSLKICMDARVKPAHHDLKTGQQS
jgi:hypothetical protein